MLSRQNLYDIFGFYEDDRFYHVSNGFHYYVCEHARPIEITSLSDDSQTVYKATTSLTTGRVEMRKYSSSDGTIGYAGKCEVCGKVYYR